MKRNFLAFGLGLAAVLAATNFPTFDGKTSGVLEPAGVSLSRENPSEDFSKIELKAKSAYVFDVQKNREIFSLNAEEKLPLASLTKLMTAIAAEENIPSYVLVSISKNAIVQEGDNGLIINERWPLHDLIDIMLISSSNDAAFALAENFGGSTSAAGATRGRTSDIAVFVDLMNKKAEELGLAQTYFLNPTGLDISREQSGAYGSAKDIARLFLYILKEKASLFEVTGYLTLKIDSREFKNTNIIINEIPRIIFSKTGASDLAGGNLTMVVDRGFENYVIIVVMGSTEEGRFEDAKALYQALITNF